MTTPSQYVPSTVDGFCGKTNRIAQLLFKKAELIRTNGGLAKWLFTGSPGLGKSALSNALASTLAHHPTAIEQMNGQSLSVDRVREWERQSYYKPIIGERYVKQIEEIDSASPAALGELRTYLDRLKGGTVVIATTNKAVKDLPESLQTRFAVFPFEPITPSDFAAFMERNFQFNYQEAYQIAQRNLGCVRAAMIDAEALMDAKELSNG